MPLNFLHPFSFICRFPPVGLSTTSCLYVVSISEFLLHPSASQQLPACIWFQYLGFPCLSTTSCAHLVSISNFPSMCLSSNFLNFLHSLGFNTYALQGVQRPSPCDTLGFPPPSHSVLFFSISTLHTSSGLSVTHGLSLVSTCVEVPHLGAFIWFQYLNFPPLCLSAISCIHSLGLKTSPLASSQLFACISTWFQCLGFPPCLSTTSRAHLVSISNFPPVPLIKLPKLPAFIGFQYLFFPP